MNIMESISGISDQGCRTDEESPSPEQMIESGTLVIMCIPPHSGMIRILM